MKKQAKAGRARGEWFVVGQFALLLLIVFLPLFGAGGGDGWWNSIGVAMLLIGLGLLIWGSWSLGANLTAMPQPKEQSVLIERGAFGLVRHPIYGGLMVWSFGWSLYTSSWVSLALALLLIILLAFKARLEEAWLLERYENYAAYRTRTKKFLPWIW